MSNRVDLFQPEQAELAIAAASAVVFLDGVLCPELEVVEIVRSGWPDFSSARLVYNPAALSCSQAESIEQIKAQFRPGAEICVSQHYNSSPPSVVIEKLPVFVGQIETIESNLSDKGEDVQIVAADYNASLKRIIVCGRYVSGIDGSAKFLIGADPIFNEDVVPNAFESHVNFNGKNCHVFAAELSSAAYWTYAEIIDYLLCIYIRPGKLSRPPLELLQALTDSQQAAELDLTGLDVLQALHQCCEHVGLNLRFLPVSSLGGPTQAIEFYKPDVTQKVELELQPGGQQLNISRTSVAAYSSRENFWPVTHRYIGLGDLKVYEATFDLVAAWDPSCESTDFDEFSPSSNPQFYQVRDVYRKWCLNETGRYTNEPYNQGPAYDFSGIFGTENYVHRARRFYPALTCDVQGRSLGYFLEVSYDDGEHWLQYLYAFDNLLDECGLWLSSDRLDLDTWIAILKGVLKFRITCSVVSDERLNCEIADGPVGAGSPVVDFCLHLPRPFRYRKVTNQSNFYGSTDPSLGKPDEADDSAALYEHLRKWAGSKSEVIETVDLQTPYLALHYSVGDRVIAAPQSRDIFGLHSDNRSTAHIEQVRMDFKNQCTNLKIIRRRNRQL
jgi:hypothetical protein